MSKIRVLTKRPGERPRHVWIENSLENLQGYVGGYIEAVTIAEDLVVICNREGRLMRLPFNCRILNKGFCGPVILCGKSGDVFAGLPTDYKTMQQLFPGLWEGGINI